MLKRINKRRLMLLLAVIGPGLVAANADNDAGGITTYSLVGAHFGFSMLWVLVLVTLSLAVTQEMGARMGAVTGKGLGGLIREKFGARWTAFPIAVMLLANLGTTNAEFAGVAASMQLFHVSKYIAVPVAAVLVFFLISKFDYRRVQKVFLVSSSLYLTYVVSGFLAHPDWLHALKSLAHPSFEFNRSYIVMFIAVIGTTITPWGQFFIQSYTVDKRLTEDDLPYARADVYVGAFFTDFISFFIIVACAATIFSAGGRIHDAADAAKALQPLAGPFASTLFGLGLLNASLLGAAVLPLTSAYATCEAFGWETGIDKTPSEAPIFYGLFTFFILASALTILIPGIPLIGVMLLSQVLNGILLPVILLFVIKITNDSEFMGKHTNSRVFRAIASLTIAGLIVATVLLLTLPLFRYVI